MRAAAAKELEDWYKHRDEQLEKTKATNRWVTVTAISDDWELKLLFRVKALQTLRLTYPANSFGTQLHF